MPLWCCLNIKGWLRTCSDDSSRVLPTKARPEAVMTCAVRRCRCRKPTLHVASPYGSHRLLMADFEQQRWV